MRKAIGVAAIISAGLLTFFGRPNTPAAAVQPNFDNLADEDRKIFTQRFEKEIWPLLVRGGKDGCVGCHNNSKTVSALKFAGDPKKDFPKLLREGFFLYKDSGSILDRVVTKDQKRRMPRKEKDRWPDKEIDILREFTIAVDKKQMR